MQEQSYRPEFTTPVSSTPAPTVDVTDTGVGVVETDLGFPAGATAPVPLKREKLDEVARELTGILQYYGSLSWQDIRRLLSVDCRRAYDAVNVLLATNVLSEVPGTEMPRGDQSHNRKPPLRFGDGAPLPGVVPLQQILPQTEYNLLGTLAATRRTFALRCWASTPPEIRVPAASLGQALDSDEREYRAVLGNATPASVGHMIVEYGRLRQLASGMAGLLSRPVPAMAEAIPAASSQEPGTSSVPEAPDPLFLNKIWEEQSVGAFIRVHPGDARACAIAYELTCVGARPPPLIRAGQEANFANWVETGRAGLEAARRAYQAARAGV